MDDDDWDDRVISIATRVSKPASAGASVASPDDDREALLESGDEQTKQNPSDRPIPQQETEHMPLPTPSQGAVWAFHSASPRCMYSVVACSLLLLGLMSTDFLATTPATVSQGTLVSMTETGAVASVVLPSPSPPNLWSTPALHSVTPPSLPLFAAWWDNEYPPIPPPSPMPPPQPPPPPRPARPLPLPMPPPSPSPLKLSADRFKGSEAALALIKQRYHRSPFTSAWPANGQLPDAGLLVHCFDAVSACVSWP